MKKAFSLLLIWGVLTALTATVWARVICSTAALGAIYEDLTGDKCEVIAPPTVCPGHYDVRPGDVEKARQAELILSHGVEPWVRELSKVSGAKVLEVTGGWNNPPELKETYISLAHELQGLGRRVNLEGCLRRVEEIEKELMRLAEEFGFKGVPVVAMKWQKPFLEYLGFRVLAFYPPPEMVSAKLYEEVLEKGRGAELVVDNLQSGSELGEKIAKKLGASHVVLSNFPLEGSLEAMMLQNAQRLAEALQSRRKGQGTQGGPVQGGR